MVPFRSHLAVTMSRHTTTVVLGLVLWLNVPGQPLLADSHPLISSWLGAQTNLNAWSAEVLQTRSLASLVHPLTASGRVWFATPNLFRWELGDPPQTIAVRQPDRMLVIYPRLQRVEVFPLEDDVTGPWRDALALLEAGFPRSQAELEARFRILGVESASDSHRIILQPRTASARRLMPRITVHLMNDPPELRATELEFADGSSMRNDFTNTILDPVLDPKLFDPTLDPDWQIVTAKP